MNIIKNINQSLSRVGSSLGGFVKSLQPRVKDVKGYKTNNSYIKGIKTKRNLSRQYLDYLNRVIQFFLDDGIQNKVKRYRDQDRILKSSLAPVLINLTIDQCFATDTSSNYMNIEVVEDNSAIREVLEEIPEALMERTKFKKLIEDNLFTFCKYGELFFEKIRNEKGFVVKLDLLDGKYIYPIYDSGEIVFYLDLDPDEDNYGRIIETKNILSFFLRGSISPIVGTNTDIEQYTSELDEEIKKDFPNYYKIGEPLLWEGRRALKRLTMLECLGDINDFRSLSMPSLVSVGVGEIKDEEHLTWLMDTYEEFLNDNSESLDLSTLEDADSDSDYSSYSSSSIKVIPVEGSGKNSIAPIDLSTPDSGTEDKVEKQKTRALQLLGFPASLLEATTSTEVKNDLQVNKRFRNTCLRLQKAIADPTRELLIEDANKYHLQDYEFTDESFNITFKNIVGLDNIEDLEIQIATISQVSSVFDTVKRVSDSSEHIKLDEAGVLSYIEDNLRPFKSAQNLFKWVDNTTDDTIEDNYSTDESYFEKEPDSEEPDSERSDFEEPSPEKPIEELESNLGGDVNTEDLIGDTEV